MNATTFEENDTVRFRLVDGRIQRGMRAANHVLPASPTHLKINQTITMTVTAHRTVSATSSHDVGPDVK
ncbi:MULTISPECIES: hypothetical protein [Nocardiaceae]|uniref:Cold-shock protein n=1 Tax=Rhodococcoides corynebacterioides TaxID=53972 RepID=A0ABS2KUB1_9NOCA|nr:MULTISPECIES: hypothetical protein [Rhodococcus]MBM7415524.1 hypothetical protein [Rhodococcus corynebacterioides]MBP1117986.1 hypothetical protein [Rhodococcus sp. PvP016]